MKPDVKLKIDTFKKLCKNTIIIKAPKMVVDPFDETKFKPSMTETIDLTIKYKMSRGSSIPIKQIVSDSGFLPICYNIVFSTVKIPEGALIDDYQTGRPEALKLDNIVYGYRSALKLVK